MGMCSGTLFPSLHVPAAIDNIYIKDFEDDMIDFSIYLKIQTNKVNTPIKTEQIAECVVSCVHLY